MSYIGRTETMETDMDYIINDATRMYERTTFRADDYTIGKKLLNQKKTNYANLENMTVDTDTIYKFLWAYRLDYLAFGYNPYDAFQKFTTRN